MDSVELERPRVDAVRFEDGRESGLHRYGDRCHCRWGRRVSSREPCANAGSDRLLLLSGRKFYLSVIDWKRVYVGTLLLTAFAVFTSPEGRVGPSWVAALTGVQLSGTARLAILLVLVALFTLFKIYEWIPSRGSKRPWVPDE